MITYNELADQLFGIFGDTPIVRSIFGLADDYSISPEQLRTLADLTPEEAFLETMRIAQDIRDGQRDFPPAKSGFYRASKDFFSDEDFYQAIETVNLAPPAGKRQYTEEEIYGMDPNTSRALRGLSTSQRDRGRPETWGSRATSSSETASSSSSETESSSSPRTASSSPSGVRKPGERQEPYSGPIRYLTDRPQWATNMPSGSPADTRRPKTWGSTKRFREAEAAIAATEEAAANPLVETFSPEAPPASVVTSNDVPVEDLGFDQAEYEELIAYLQETWGGAAFFFDLDADKLMIGVDAKNRPVLVDSEEAVKNVHLLNYLVDIGDGSAITDDAGILNAIQKTDWYLTTNASMREFDAKFQSVDGAIALVGEKNVEERVAAELQKVQTFVREMGLSGVIDEQRMLRIALNVDRLGYELNDTKIKELISQGEEGWSAFTNAMSESKNMYNYVDALSKEYYLTLPQSQVDELATDLYMGNKTDAQIRSFMTQAAMDRFTYEPLQNALRAGQTVSGFFSPYAGELEMILERPVDLFEEFPQVFENAENGGAPMTYQQMREFGRSLPEWSKSVKGQTAAYDMVDNIGRLFGEKA